MWLQIDIDCEKKQEIMIDFLERLKTGLVFFETNGFNCESSEIFTTPVIPIKNEYKEIVKNFEPFNIRDWRISNKLEIFFGLVDENMNSHEAQLAYDYLKKIR